MSETPSVSKRSQWDWLPWRVAARNRASLDQLQRHGLTDSDRKMFEAVCRAGRPTPDYLIDRLIAAADAARAAGEERV